MTVSHELQARALFDARYGIALSPVARQIERRVIGGDWGGQRLHHQGPGLHPYPWAWPVGYPSPARHRHGRGWPGLYLAPTTGCPVVLTDLPLEGLRVAADRATAEGLATRAAMVVAAGGLPFRAGSFGAIVHTLLIAGGRRVFADVEAEASQPGATCREAG